MQCQTTQKLLIYLICKLLSGAWNKNWLPYLRGRGRNENGRMLHVRSNMIRVHNTMQYCIQQDWHRVVWNYVSWHLQKQKEGKEQKLSIEWLFVNSPCRVLACFQVRFAVCLHLLGTIRKPIRKKRPYPEINSPF